MEDQETGELFLPCKRWTEKCCKNHLKQKEKESSEGSAYFSKIMLGDFAEKLRIPLAFVPWLINEAGEDIFLQGPNGKEWVVKLWGTNTKLEFRHGWGNFVHYHDIEFGDFVVFKYISRSNFKVRIFGRNGCVKNIVVCEPKKTNTDLGKTKRYRVDEAGIEKECNDEAEVVAENLWKKAKPTLKIYHDVKSPNGHYKIEKSPETKKCYYVSSRRPVSEAERRKALKAAESFKSEKPFCLVTMNPNSGYRGFMVAFPKTCELVYLPLSGENGELVLVDPNSKEWNV